MSEKRLRTRKGVGMLGPDVSRKKRANEKARRGRESSKGLKPEEEIQAETVGGRWRGGGVRGGRKRTNHENLHLVQYQKNWSAGKGVGVAVGFSGKISESFL